VCLPDLHDSLVPLFLHLSFILAASRTSSALKRVYTLLKIYIHSMRFDWRERNCRLPSNNKTTREHRNGNGNQLRYLRFVNIASLKALLFRILKREMRQLF
jgi:hypothetical protein